MSSSFVFMQLLCGDSIYATGNKLTSSFLVAFCLKVQRNDALSLLRKVLLWFFPGILKLFVKEITDSLR